eukprot:6881020-Prymnesium_polylepis.1
MPPNERPPPRMPPRRDDPCMHHSLPCITVRSCTVQKRSFTVQDLFCPPQGKVQQVALCSSWADIPRPGLSQAQLDRAASPARGSSLARTSART